MCAEAVTCGRQTTIGRAISEASSGASSEFSVGARGASTPIAVSNGRPEMHVPTDGRADLRVPVCVHLALTALEEAICTHRPFAHTHAHMHSPPSGKQYAHAHAHMHSPPSEKQVQPVTRKGAGHLAIVNVPWARWASPVDSITGSTIIEEATCDRACDRACVRACV